MKKIKEISTKLNNYKFFLLLIFIIVVAFYWWQIRPAHVRSSCSHIAVLIAKSDSYSSTDLYSLYVTSTAFSTYNGFNAFLEREYKNDKNFVMQTYDSGDYNFDYSRCLHEYGL